MRIHPIPVILGWHAQPDRVGRGPRDITQSSDAAAQGAVTEGTGGPNSGTVISTRGTMHYQVRHAR
ncbi:hypothetical protein GCM10009574_021330 [Streptomyces asiaticus]|uniref:Uncharacterized protein n=2 Tax=Streptomyces rhizosphaericus TaxID=114699 RepID=A0ABP4D8Z8_9ACTN